MTTNRPLRVFLCHSSNDKPAVRELYQKLRAEPWIQPWLDEEELYPGQDWETEIEKAVEASDVVLVCLSNGSINKRGFVQKELRYALDVALEMPEETVFIIPLRLEDCNPPRSLREWQYLDYFPKYHQARAYQRLIDGLKLRVAKLGIIIEDEKIKTKRKQNAKEEREHVTLQKNETERIVRAKAEVESNSQKEHNLIAEEIKSEDEPRLKAQNFSGVYADKDENVIEIDKKKIRNWWIVFLSSLLIFGTLGIFTCFFSYAVVLGSGTYAFGGQEGTIPSSFGVALLIFAILLLLIPVLILFFKPRNK